MAIIIKNGILVTSEFQRSGDVKIDNGIIASIQDQIPITEIDTVIDARGKFVFAGAIDPHVHMQLPTPAGPSADSFRTGRMAALMGGTTSLIDFVTPHRGQSLTVALENRLSEAAEDRPYYSFHVSPVEWNSDTEDQMIECIRMGFRSFKVYLAYLGTVGIGDDVLWNVMSTAARHGAMVLAHCEVGEEIDGLRNFFAEAGNTQAQFHALSRPAYTESDAVKHAIELAEETGCPLYIVHVSAAESLIHIREAKARGSKVYAETCPQYLLFDDTCYAGSFEQIAPFVISPPIRTKTDQDALWLAIADGTIDTVGTDHCPFNYAQKLFGLNDFRRIPNGAGGVEHRLELLFTYGVLTNRITIQQMIKLVCEMPASIYQLAPRKGFLVPDADGDIVVWDPEIEKTISASTHHQNCDLNIYESLRVKGSPSVVILGGQIIYSRQEE